MSGLLFPKQRKKKRRKKHQSILQKKDGRCFLCMILYQNYIQYPEVDKHHAFRGKNRQICEEEGLTVYLCRRHHTAGKEAVHNNKEMDELVKNYARAAWLQNHTTEEFYQRFEIDF